MKRHQHAEGRTPSTWKAVLTAAVIVASIAGLFTLTMALLYPPGTVFEQEARVPEGEAMGLYNPVAPPQAVVYDAERLVAVETAVQLPDEELVEIGRSEEGYRVFAHRPPAEVGGGGGLGSIRDLYLKSVDGDYLRLAPEAR